MKKLTQETIDSRLTQVANLAQKNQKTLETKLDFHEQKDVDRFAKQYDFNGVVAEDLRVIKENHLAHIQNDMSTMRTTVEVIQEGMRWQNKIAYFVAVIVSGVAIYLIGHAILP